MAQKIIIVGAGIIGASAAWHLARAGADVTVIDAGADRATDASFGWVNASYFANADHFRLRAAGMQAWQTLLAALGVQPLAQGSLAWDQPEDGLHRQYATLKDLDYPVEWISKDQFSKLEPGVARPPDAALFFPSEQVIDAADCATRMLAQSGASVVRGVRVDALSPGKVHTAFGTLCADDIVVAAGTQTQRLIAGLGADLCLRPSPTFVLHTQPARRVSRHVLATPVGDIRQRSDGVFVMPTDVNHQSDHGDAAGTRLDTLQADAMGRLTSLFPDLGLTSAGLTLAHRPMPCDGVPIVGAVCTGVYAAVMHSGVTLAALMGDLISQEVMRGATNQTIDWLAPYRPDRFAVT